MPEILGRLCGENLHMDELPVDLPQFPMGPSRSLTFIWCGFLLGKFDPLIEGVVVLRFRMCCEEMV